MSRSWWSVEVEYSVVRVQMFKKDWKSVVAWMKRPEQLTRRRKVHWPIGGNHKQSSNVPIQVHVANDVVSSSGIRVGRSWPSLIEDLFNLWSIECSIPLELIRLDKVVLCWHGIVIKAW